MPEPTPGQTVGPFFGFALPYDGDAALVPAGSAGAIRLHGTVYDGAGDPVPDAILEIRQADPAGNVPASDGSLARDAGFTGWGRCATDAAGHYAFTTLEPGTGFVAVTVFARGLLDRLFTRAYLPEADEDALLASLPAERRDTLRCRRDADGDLAFDVHLQGEAETVFLSFPGHRG